MTTKRIILNDQGGSLINWEYSDTCPTLRSQTKGHEPIIMENEPKVYENHGQDSRIKEVKTAPQLNASAGTGGGNLPLVQEQGCDPFNGTVTGTVTVTVTANTGGTTAKGPKVCGVTVRRLTPTECERLQGFPDGYTAIPWKKKPASECPDGPRYKALGNSWAVPCARWLGERIAAVEARLNLPQEDLW
jgi:site-specific DNA-cytosine methylase